MVIQGAVDASTGAALVPISLRRAPDAEAHPLEVWIDTAFTGDLALSLDMIQRLGLTRTSTVLAVLADGSTRKVESYLAFVEWFGEVREVEIVAGQNPIPLLGVTLLLGGVSKSIIRRWLSVYLARKTNQRFNGEFVSCFVS